MRREKREVRNTQWADEQKMIEFQEKPLAIYCAGGYPKICKRTIETHHEGDSGFDFAEVAFIVDNKPVWLVDSDLITPAERRKVIDMCKNYGSAHTNTD